MNIIDDQRVKTYVIYIIMFIQSAWVYENLYNSYVLAYHIEVTIACRCKDT